MSNDITPTTRLTVLKHLAAGKKAEMVGSIMKLSRYEVIDIASEHGYPDVAKMTQAVRAITASIEAEQRAVYLTPSQEVLHSPSSAIVGEVGRGKSLPPRSGPGRGVPTPPVSPKPSAPPRPAPTAATGATGTTAAPAAPAAGVGAEHSASHVLTQPDELRTVINAGKQSSSKRVQALTNRIIDELDRLKDAISAEQVKTEAARRKAAAKAAAVRARAAEREALQKKKADLEAELAAVKAKLRGRKTTQVKVSPSSARSNSSSASPAVASPGEEVPAKEIRAWAREFGWDVPDAGRVPQKVREAYAAVHASDQVA